jgi:hypothetical protein
VDGIVEIPEVECERCGGPSEASSFIIMSGRRDDGEKISEAAFIYVCLNGCLMNGNEEEEQVPFEFSVANYELTRRFCMTAEERAVGDLLDSEIS